MTTATHRPEQKGAGKQGGTTIIGVRGVTQALCDWFVRRRRRCEASKQSAIGWSDLGAGIQITKAAFDWVPPRGVLGVGRHGRGGPMCRFLCPADDAVRRLALVARPLGCRSAPVPRPCVARHQHPGMRRSHGGRGWGAPVLGDSRPARPEVRPTALR